MPTPKLYTYMSCCDWFIFYLFENFNFNYLSDFQETTNIDALTWMPLFSAHYFNYSFVLKVNMISNIDDGGGIKQQGFVL